MEIHDVSSSSNSPPHMPCMYPPPHRVCVETHDVSSSSHDMHVSSSPRGVCWLRQMIRTGPAVSEIKISETKIIGVRSHLASRSLVTL